MNFEQLRAEEHQGMGAVRRHRIRVLEASWSEHGADLGQTPGRVREEKGSFGETHTASVSKTSVTSEKRFDPFVHGHRGVR